MDDPKFVWTMEKLREIEKEYKKKYEELLKSRGK